MRLHEQYDQCVEAEAGDEALFADDSKVCRETKVKLMLSFDRRVPVPVAL